MGYCNAPSAHSVRELSACTGSSHAGSAELLHMLWMDDDRNALVDFRQSACSVLEDGCMQGTHTLKDSFTLNARTGAP